MPTIPVYNLRGEKTGNCPVPETLSGKINLPLLAQASYVYLSNQRRGLAQAMTRGESGRTTAKMYRQKHTGRARHGSKSAPIFVGGGIAHGPTGNQNYHRGLPGKMRRQAVISAFLAKQGDNSVFVIDDLGSISAKTQSAARILKSLGLLGRKVIIASLKKTDNLDRAFRNLPGIILMPVSGLNAYSLLNTQALVIDQPALKWFGSPVAQTRPENVETEVKTTLPAKAVVKPAAKRQAAKPPVAKKATVKAAPKRKTAK